MSVLEKKSFSDIIFNERNKNFGAFRLRERYHRYILLSFLGSSFLFVMGLGGPVVYNRLKGNKPEPKKEVVAKMVEVEIEDIPPIQPEEVAPPPPAVEAPPPKVNSVRYVPPEVVPDEEVVEEAEIPDHEELEESNPGTETQEGSDEIVLEESISTDEVNDLVGHEEPKEEKVYQWVEQQAEFHGGSRDLIKYLVTNISVTSEAKSKGVDDFAVVEFVVHKDGSITDVKIKKPVGLGMDPIILKAVERMPSWQPAKMGGKEVTSKKQLKIPVKVQ